MKMRSAFLAALAGVSLSLTACGGDTLDGTVTKKDVKPMESGYYYVPIYTSSCSGSPPTCTQILSGLIPTYWEVPECPRLWVRNDEGDVDKGCVTQARWDSAEVGGSYTGSDVKPKRQEKEVSDAEAKANGAKEKR